jgi:hypothetical protein
VRATIRSLFSGHLGGLLGEWRAAVARPQEAAHANRWDQRDATMILVAYRQGFRASELVDLQ